MPYTITKQITRKKKQPFRPALNILLFLAAIPVAAIALICLLLYFTFLWARSFFITGGPEAEPYRQELILVQNASVTITLAEDELDTELTQLNEVWMAEVYDEETCLYRATTVPHIDALNGRICCFYCKEKPDGTLLQVLHPLPAMNQPLHTQLVFLHYPDLQVTVIGDAGPFYLYNEEKNTQLIKGFNREENIQIEVKSIV